MEKTNVNGGAIALGMYAQRCQLVLNSVAIYQLAFHVSTESMLWGGVYRIRGNFRGR